jgi:hypothetical protein
VGFWDAFALTAFRQAIGVMDDNAKEAILGEIIF